jgi:hypothetical protein
VNIYELCPTLDICREKEANISPSVSRRKVPELNSFAYY